MEDVVKSEVKKIGDFKWKFSFRENGYVAVVNVTDCPEAKMHFMHSPNIESCLAYVYSKCDACNEKTYEELEDAC